MVLNRKMSFVVVLLVLMLNGIEACFRSSEHQNYSVTTGISFYKECQCTEPGYTISNLRWLNKYGAPIGKQGPGTNIYAEEQSDSNSINLHIPNITKSMSGTYTCETLVEGRRYTQSYTIEAYEPIYFMETPSDQHLVYGQTSWITCKPKSDGNVIIVWQKEYEKDVFSEVPKDGKYVAENDKLVIHDVTENDAGKYKCTAEAFVTNEVVDKYIEVTVMRIPEIAEIRASTLVLTDKPITVVAGMNLTVECIADGTPHPEYFWNKTSDVDAQEFDEVSYRQPTSSQVNTIIFDDIQPEDRGTYTCYASNLAGTAVMDTFIEVLVPPRILDFPNITDVEGTKIKILCNATGKPEPSINIRYEGRNMNWDTNMIDPDINPMDVMMLHRAIEGVYVCEASNEVGSVEEAMYLTVFHQPYFDVPEEYVWGWEGKTINLNCQHDSNPAADITWRFYGNNIQIQDEIEMNRLLASVNNMPEPYFTLTIDNKTSYGNFECTAKNYYGQATKRITLVEAFVPGPVKDVIIEDLTATSVTYNITGPDRVDGPEVIGFTATYDEAKNFNITDIHINRTWAIGRPFRLDKLKPNTTYYVRFAAQNEVGVGVWSEFYPFHTLDKSVPGTPVWDEVPISLARNSHVLKWRAPDDNGEPIEHYTLRYCLVPDLVEVEEPCQTIKILECTETELVDLEFNTTYFLELVAHNSMGDSIPANVTVLVPAPLLDSPSILLSGGAIIGISIVIVVVCLLLLDVLLLVWRRQGIIATCCFKKESKSKESVLNSRDRKGLLTNGESEDRSGSRNNGHKEFQYNKSTGVVTGKHSAV